MNTSYQLKIGKDPCSFRVLWAAGQTTWAPWYVYERLDPEHSLHLQALAEVRLGRVGWPASQVLLYPLTRPLAVTTNQTQLRLHPDDGQGLWNLCGQWPPAHGVTSRRLILTFTWEHL